MTLFVFLLKFDTVPTVWYSLFIYWTLEMFRQCSFFCVSMWCWNCSDNMTLFVFHFFIGLWNCSDSVALFVFLCDFGTVPSIWRYLFFYWTLILIRQCGIICLSIGIWNCSDSVAFFVFQYDFGTVPTIRHYLILYWTLELFRQCGIICFSIELWNCSDSVKCFSIGHWNCSESVALFIFLLDIGTVPTVWHHLLFNWTLELFGECGIICFSFFYLILELFRHCSVICCYMGLWNCSDSVASFVFR